MPHKRFISMKNIHSSFKHINSVVFDLDGTLVDTAPDLVAATNQTLINNGYQPAPFEKLRIASSHGSVALIKTALPTVDDKQIEALKPKFLQCYQQINGNHSIPFAGVLKGLARLKSQGITLGIVTNKPARFVYPLLKKLNLTQDFNSIICGDTCKWAKPNPAPMLLAAQQLNTPCHQIVYLGDAQRDMEAANNTKMLSILALWGYISSKDKPDSWSASYKFLSITDFIDAFLIDKNQP